MESGRGWFQSNQCRGLRLLCQVYPERVEDSGKQGPCREARIRENVDFMSKAICLMFTTLILHETKSGWRRQRRRTDRRGSGAPLVCLLTFLCPCLFGAFTCSRQTSTAVSHSLREISTRSTQQNAHALALPSHLHTVVFHWYTRAKCFRVEQKDCRTPKTHSSTQTFPKKRFMALFLLRRGLRLLASDDQRCPVSELDTRLTHQLQQNTPRVAACISPSARKAFPVTRLMHNHVYALL